MKALLLTLCLTLASAPVLAEVAPYHLNTTENGGAYGHGTVFRAVKGKRTTLYDFCPKAESYCYDGERPIGGVAELPDGSIVGTTSKGGDYGAGTIWRLFPTSIEHYAYHHIWAVCWVEGDCGYYGTPRGTLEYMGTDKNGYYVLDGVCEGKNGGILYELVIDPQNEQAIISLSGWKNHRKIDAVPNHTVVSFEDNW